MSKSTKVRIGGDGEVSYKPVIYKKRFLCYLGWHRWSWKLLKGEAILLDGPPPDRARCKFCNIPFKK